MNANYLCLFMLFKRIAVKRIYKIRKNIKCMSRSSKKATAKDASYETVLSKSSKYSM